MIGVTVTAPDLSKWVRLVPTPDDLVLLANDAVNVIKPRTLAGEDVDGSNFAPYSANYKKYREDKGRSSEVNLAFHGRMLASMSTRKISGGAEIFFRDAERGLVAYKHNEGEGVPKRRFFDLSEREFDKLAEMLLKRLEARAR